MKINNELRDIIKKAVYKKYEEPLRLLACEISQVKEFEQRKNTDIVLSAIEGNEYAIRYIRRTSYSQNGDSLYQIIYNNISKFIDVNTTEEIRLSAEYKKLTEQRDSEISKIIIELTYGKTVVDLEETLSKYGVEI